MDAKSPTDTEHLIEVAVEPKSRGDLDRLHAALETLTAQDPSLAYSCDRESGQTILKAASEDHLAKAVEQLRASHAIEAVLGSPQVAYRETLSKSVEIDYTHKKQTGGSGQFARVKILFEPLPPGSGFIFEDENVGAVPKEYAPGVEKGLNASRDNGVLAGFPLIDFKATLIDGAYHEVDSKVFTFEIATRAAFRELKERKAVKLIEPMMKVEVVTPDEYVGGVVGDLNARRGKIQGTDQRGNEQVITALVPLAGMLGYAEALKALSRGRATFAMRFERYDDVLRGFDDDDPGRFPPAAAMRA